MSTMAFLGYSLVGTMLALVSCWDMSEADGDADADADDDSDENSDGDGDIDADSDGHGDADGGDDEVCEHGETLACVCTGGSNGTQSCTEDRMGWDECVCTQECNSLTITADTTSVPIGSTLQLTATCLSGDSTFDVTNGVLWESNETIALVNDAGVVTGIDVGTATITATYTHSELYTTVGTFDVTVLTYGHSISISPATPITLSGVGLNQQYTATCLFGDEFFDCTTANSVLWESSDTAIAVISNEAGTEGLATSTAHGTTSIWASIGGSSSNIAVLIVEE